MEWVTDKIQIGAFYLSDHPEEKMNVSCRSVSLIPEQFSETVGADGSISRSITKSASLLVEGVDAPSLASLGWEPQSLTFSDVNTGTPQSFNVRRVRVTGSSTAAFDLC